jgi:hypothetical protein
VTDTMPNRSAIARLLLEDEAEVKRTLSLLRDVDVSSAGALEAAFGAYAELFDILRPEIETARTSSSETRNSRASSRPRRRQTI